MSETPPDLAMPHFEDELWDELAGLYAAHPSARRNGRGPRRQRRRRGGPGRRDSRRPIVVAVAGLVAAAVLVVVAVAWPESDGAAPARRVETIDLPDPAVVVDGVLQATEPGEGEPFILHETESWGEGIDRTETWYDDVTFARRELTTSADGDPLMDSGWPEPPALDAPPMGREPDVTGFDQCVGGLAMDEEGNIYSCDSGEPVESGLPPGHATVAVNHCSRTWFRTEGPLMQEYGFGYLRLYLETGDIVVDGTAEHEGRQLIRIRNQDASYVWLVDPETYQPVVAFEESTGSPRVTRTYERLPRTEENLALLSPAVPGDYTEATGEDVLQDAIESPCAENPSDDAEVVGAVLPDDLEDEACDTSVGADSEALYDDLETRDPGLAEEARRDGVVLDCDGDGEPDMALVPAPVTTSD
jgi:hypothetical protein